MASKKKKLESSSVETWQVNLTAEELTHLRDMFSICLPPDLSETISQSLGKAEGRQYVEAKLWIKLGQACLAAGVSLGDDAPDFVVTPVAPPPMGVYRVNMDPPDQSAETGILSELAEKLGLTGGQDEDEDVQSGTGSVHSTKRKNSDSTSPRRRRNNKKVDKG